MKLARLRRLLADNPQASRLVLTTLTGPRLGVAFLLVALCLLGAYIGLFVYFLDVGVLDDQQSAGNLIYFWQNVVLYALLSLLLPLKVAGAVEGARFGRAFDQVVVTGASPFVFHFGSWAVGLLYAALLLIPSLPFSACATLFGGLDPARIASGYAILLLYANVIIAVTLGLGVLEREWITTPLCVGGFWLLGIFSLIVERDWLWGYPVHVAEITPLRYFYRHSIPFDPEIFGPGGSWQAHSPFADPVFYTLSVPLAVYPYLLWGLVIALVAAVLVLGPAHRFSRGLNNFGTVTLPGDRKRRFLKRMRGGLTRRVEVAFFYENRPAWCARWDFLIRAAVGMVPLLWFWGLLFGRIYGGSPSASGGGFFRDESMAACIVFSFLALGLWILLHADPKHKVYWRERLCGFELPRELLLLAGFGVVLGCLFAAHWWTFDAIIDEFDAGLARVPDSESLASARADYQRHWWAMVPGLCLFGLNLFLLSRVFSRGSQSPHFARAVTVLAGIVLTLVPMLCLALIWEGLLPPAFLAFGSLSPFALAEMRGSALSVWDVDSQRLYYFALHGGLAGLLIAFLLFCHWMRRRLERRQTASAAVPAAAALGLALGVVGWTSTTLDAQTPAPEPPRAKGIVTIDTGGDGERRRGIPGLVIEDFTRGFNGRVFHVQTSFWTLRIRNAGQETIRGTLRFEAGAAQTAAEPFELGPGTTRVLRGSPERRSLSRPDRLEAMLPLRAIFEAGGRREATDAALVQALYTPPRRGRVPAGSAAAAPEPPKYLLVGKREGVAGAFFDAVLPDKAMQNLVDCPVELLPEEAKCYAGVDVVILGPQDLGLWTPGQRLALYEFVRHGGAAVFYGGLDASGLAGAPPWQDILRSSSSRRLEAAGAFFRIEDLEEGRVAWSIDAGGDAIPLLSVRRAGAGSIGHLSFAFNNPRLPDGLEKSAAFWKAFGEALPRSAYPLLAQQNPFHDVFLWDIAALFILGGYFLAYALIHAGILFFFCRERRRQLRLWLSVALVPLPFLFGLPLLNTLLHSRPSYADLSECLYAAPGSSRALLVAELRLRSSGRQDHELRIRGRSPAACEKMPFHWWSYHEGYLPFGPTLPLEGPVETAAARSSLESGLDRGLALRTAPWSAWGAVFTDLVPYQAPLQGWVALDRSRGVARIHLEAAARALPGQLRLLCWNLRPDEFAFFDVSPAPGSRRVADVEAPVSGQGGSNPSWALDAGRGWFIQLEIDEPRVVAAWSPSAGEDFPGLSIESRDLAFEREIAERVYEANRSRGGDVSARDGRFYQSFRHRLVLVELPVKLAGE
jgi:hypothetical protein